VNQQEHLSVLLRSVFLCCVYLLPLLSELLCSAGAPRSEASCSGNINLLHLHTTNLQVVLTPFTLTLAMYVPVGSPATEMVAVCRPARWIP